MSVFEDDDAVSCLVTSIINDYEGDYGPGSKFETLKHNLTKINRTFNNNMKFGEMQSDIVNFKPYKNEMIINKNYIYYGMFGTQRVYSHVYDMSGERYGPSIEFVKDLMCHKMLSCHPNILPMKFATISPDKTHLTYKMNTHSIADVIKFSQAGPAPEQVVVRMLLHISRCLLLMEVNGIVHGNIDVHSVHMDLVDEVNTDFYLHSFGQGNAHIAIPHRYGDLRNLAMVALAFMHKNVGMIEIYDDMLRLNASFGEFYEMTCKLNKFDKSVMLPETITVYRNERLMNVLYHMLTYYNSRIIIGASRIIELLKSFDCVEHSSVTIPRLSYITDNECFASDPFVKHPYLKVPTGSCDTMWEFASRVLISNSDLLYVSFHVTVTHLALYIMYDFMHRIANLSIENMPTLKRNGDVDTETILLLHTVSIACLSIASKLSNLYALSTIYNHAQYIHEADGISQNDIATMECVILNTVSPTLYTRRTLCRRLVSKFKSLSQNISWETRRLILQLSTPVLIYHKPVDLSPKALIHIEFGDLYDFILRKEGIYVPLIKDALLRASTDSSFTDYFNEPFFENIPELEQELCSKKHPTKIEWISSRIR